MSLPLSWSAPQAQSCQKWLWTWLTVIVAILRLQWLYFFFPNHIISFKKITSGLKVKIIEMKVRKTKLNWSLITLSEANKFLTNYSVVWCFIAPVFCSIWSQCSFYSIIFQFVFKSLYLQLSFNSYFLHALCFF